MKPLVLFGDSNTTGFGVTNGQDYPSLLASTLGVSKTLVAQSGHMAADQSSLLYGVTPSADNAYTVMLGTNDAQFYGANAIKQAAYVNFLRAIAVWCAVPNRVHARSAAMTLSGSWSNTPVNSIGKMVSASGATATAAVCGSAVYIAYILQNLAASEGAFTVAIDGVVVGTVLTNGTAVGSSMVGQSYAPACVRFGGLTPGWHTVTITTTNANTVFLDWIAGSMSGAKPSVYVANVIERTSAGYGSGSNDANVASYGAAALAMAAELASDGLAVSTVDLSSFNPATNLQADGIHANPAGHAVLQSLFLSALAPVGTVSYPYVRGGTVEVELLAGVAQKVTIQ